MLTFPKYESYKDSGVEWLGEIPSHWDFRRLKHIAKVRLSNVDKHSRANELPVRLCNYTDVYYKDLITRKIAFMESTATEEQIHNFLLEEGDVLITKDSESFDDIAVPAYVPETLENVICGYHLAHIKPIHIEGSYLFRAFQAEDISSQFRVSANGITRFGISKSAINDAIFLLPPIEEQRRIAQFLDRTTTDIDRAIAQKQRLIELLQEQKAILINQAVTKGLNPNTPMRDSGIEWLGEIPEHWSINRIKHLAKKVGSGITPRGGGENYLDQGILFIRSQNVYFDGLRLDDAVYINEKTHSIMSNTSVSFGDVLLNITGASIGRSCVFKEKAIEANVNQHVCIVRPNYKIRSWYLSCLFESKLGQEQIWLSQNGASREGLNFADLKTFIFPIPPVNEQEEIEQKIFSISETIKETIASIEKEINVLQEFKSCLITQSVTGKIKV